MAKATSAYFTPLVRLLADTYKIDLESLAGSGRGGRIRKQDVLAAAMARVGSKASKTTYSAIETVKAPSPILRDALTTVIEVDLSDLEQFAIETNEHSTLAALVHATVSVLRSHSTLNALIDPVTATVMHCPSMPVAIAMAGPLGQMGVIRDAADLNLAALKNRIQAIYENGASTGATPEGNADDVTLTIVDLRNRGSIFDSLPIPLRQIATLGIGGLSRRAVVIGGANGYPEGIAIRTVAHLTLSYDRCFLSGNEAAEFLRAIKGILEN